MLRPALISVVYLVCWVALDALSSIFKVVPNVTVWSPQEGLSFVLLFVFGLRYWPVLLLNTPLHAYFVFEGTFPLWEIAIFDVTKTIIYAGAAFLLVRRIKIDRSLGHQRDVIWFVGVACLAAPLLVALIEAPFLTAAAGLESENLLRNIVSWWAGDATGIAMVAPFLLVFLSRFGRVWDQPPTEEAAKAALPSRKEVPVFALQMIAMVVALLAAYRFELPGTLEYSYFAFAPLMWIAVSNGFVRTTFGIVVANFGAAILAATRNVEEVGVPLQFSLMTLTIVGLLVAGIVTERNLVSKLLAYEALHDPLTGLPNRKLFLRQLEEAVRRAAKEPEYSFAVFFLSLEPLQGHQYKPRAPVRGPTVEGRGGAPDFSAAPAGYRGAVRGRRISHTARRRRLETRGGPNGEVPDRRLQRALCTGKLPDTGLCKRRNRAGRERLWGTRKPHPGCGSRFAKGES